MYLKTLKLTNFRNYKNLQFEFDNSLVLLYGDNAQGKSSFLESIYFASTTKSLKAQKDEELVRQGEEICRVEVLVDQTETAELEIAMQLIDSSLTKRVKVNGVPRRVLDYIGNFYVVLFAPEDINLVNGAPSLRRWHIDLTLAQIDKEYKKALTEYGEVLTKRNKLLKNIKEGLSSPTELVFWSDELLRNGQIVSKKRRELFEFLNQTERKFGEFKYVYKESEITKERLQEYQGREIAAAMSLIGPHRDDFGFFLEDKDLSKFGSRGELRTAVVDLKMSQVLFYEHKTKKRPILLLDDVFSELDLLHRQHVLNLTLLQQTIVASVEMDEHLKSFFTANGRIFKVELGVVSPF